MSATAASSAVGFKKGLASERLDGSQLRIGISRAKWNAPITGALLRGAVRELLELGVSRENIIVTEVPGAYEVVFGAQWLIRTQKVNAVLCIGCLIKGETKHFEYICKSVGQGIMDLGLRTSVPVLFGVLTCLTEQQAMARAGLVGNHGNEGVRVLVLRRSVRRSQWCRKPDAFLRLHFFSSSSHSSNPSSLPSFMYFSN